MGRTSWVQLSVCVRARARACVCVCVCTHEALAIITAKCTGAPEGRQNGCKLSNKNNFSSTQVHTVHTQHTYVHAWNTHSHTAREGEEAFEGSLGIINEFILKAHPRKVVKQLLHTVN